LAAKKYERFEINVFGYGCAASGNYHDDNWLSVEISISCGGFHGKFPAMFFTGDLQSFHAQLVSLYQILTGTAKFETLEGQLKLEVPVMAWATSKFPARRLTGPASVTSSSSKLILTRPSFKLRCNRWQRQCQLSLFAPNTSFKADGFAAA